LALDGVLIFLKVVRRLCTKYVFLTIKGYTMLPFFLYIVFNFIFKKNEYYSFFENELKKKGVL
jgi:hypothetical protein